jgi:hypothetical protein
VADGVEAAVVPLACLLLEARPGGHIDLTPENRLDLGPARLLVELHGSEEVAVVREGGRRHPQGAGPLEERLDLDGAVEERVLAVEVEVDEGRGRHRAYSHSIVAGGFEDTSYTTRLMPFTSLMMRLAIEPRTASGNRAQSAVMASTDVTHRTAMAFS